MHCDSSSLAEQTLSRCRAIAAFTEIPGQITRTFLSPPMRDCHHAIASWMHDLGMQVGIDAIGNLRGLHGIGHRPRLLIGSHLDTVPEAGAYDGILGVCIALALIEATKASALPFDIEVLGFSEEEGVRFRAPFLGSLAAAGRFNPKLLDLEDSTGCTMRDAITRFGLDPARIEDARIDDRAFAFLEFHIEQGPVLDSAGESIAAVSAIAGQSRWEAIFSGRANHAGTTPMHARRDALTGAAEWITAVEQHARSVDGLVATVGALKVSPGAGNVIPGEVRASLDVRNSCDHTRLAAVRTIRTEAERIAAGRDLHACFEERLNQNAVPMDEHLVGLIEQAMHRIGETPRRMVSGAGHDAMIMAEKVPSAMIFLRSPGGISHHPGEAVRAEDVEKAIRAGTAMLTDLANEPSRADS
ncbi:MAG TPA: allantoate amidohydrolase [Bryobacteraceae bacterium]|jgi:allantoate deiminase|nr:allantoate amidohydrolase [Bryobacteraceae bacterium]